MVRGLAAPVPLDYACRAMRRPVPAPIVRPPVSAVRALCQVLKLHTMLPFFNQPDAEKAVSQPGREEA